MTPERPVSATCVRESDAVLDAAKTMADHGVGALPICGEDNRLKGMLTDRDIVVRVFADGKDPRAPHAGELARGEAVNCHREDFRSPANDARVPTPFATARSYRQLPVGRHGAGFSGS
jgi:CBS domain-containing protein